MTMPFPLPPRGKRHLGGVCGVSGVNTPFDLTYVINNSFLHFVHQNSFMDL